MTNPTPYKTLLLSAAVAFTVILALYAVYAPNPVTSRLGFAVFMSMIPALATLCFLKLTKLNLSRWIVALIYAGVFLALWTSWDWIRG